MVNLPRWQFLLVLIISALGVLLALPSALPEQSRSVWPLDRLPVIQLGLDLQGGAYLLGQADLAKVETEFVTDYVDALKAAARRERIPFTPQGLPRQEVPGGPIRLILRDAAQMPALQALLPTLPDPCEPQQCPPEIQIEGASMSLTLPPAALSALRNGVIEKMTAVIRRRIDGFGLTEPVVQPQGTDRIRIEVPGFGQEEVADGAPRRTIEDLKALIGSTATMTFHMVLPPDQIAGPGTLMLSMDETTLAPGELNIPLPLERRPVLRGEDLASATLGFHPETNEPVVNFRFNGNGSRIFCDVTSRNPGRRFAIVLDQKIIMAPVINEPICGGSGFIYGNFSLDEASRLAILMSAGALPTDLIFLQESTIGPSLGADSVEAGETAALVALGLVALYMIGMYGLFGLFSIVAVLVNLALIFAALALFGASLSLPGIAGIVLTIGMAVDSNVLIYERIKEERRSGKSVIASIDSGFQEAFTTITDANVTALIGGLCLAWIGAGPVRGFAVTLAIGVVTSMFTAIMVTRLLVVAWMRTTRPKTLAI